MTSRADRKYFLTLHQYFQFSVLTSGLDLIRLFLQLKSNKSVGGGRAEDNLYLDQSREGRGTEKKIT